MKVLSPNLKPSVIYRLQPSTSKKCPSVFTRIRNGKNHKISVFNRIKDVPHPKHSIFARMKTDKKSSSSRLQRQKSSMFSRLGVINEVQSSIPSHMKRFSSLDVKTDNSLRENRSTVIFTSQQNNSNSNQEAEEEEVVFSNHITTHECDNSDSEIELAETPESFEDGGQTIVNELNELNLGPMKNLVLFT